MLLKTASISLLHCFCSSWHQSSNRPHCLAADLRWRHGQINQLILFLYKELYVPSKRLVMDYGWITWDSSKENVNIYDSNSSIKVCLFVTGYICTVVQNWSLYLFVLSSLFESCQKQSRAQRVIQNSITIDGLGERLRTMASLKLVVLASTVRQQSANNIKVSWTALVGLNLCLSNAY